MNDQAFLNYLGIAKRSSNLLVGSEGVIKNMPFGKIELIILASDASFNTKDKITKKAFFYQIKIIEKFNSNEISKATGTKSIMVLGITSKGIADGALKTLE